jgi:hypothetical protein
MKTRSDSEKRHTWKAKKLKIKSGCGPPFHDFLKALKSEKDPAVVGTAVVGTAVVAGSAVEGTAVAGTAVAGIVVEGTAVEGTAVEGTAVVGTAVAGTAVVVAVDESAQIRMRWRSSFQKGAAPFGLT